MKTEATNLEEEIFRLRVLGGRLLSHLKGDTVDPNKLEEAMEAFEGYEPYQVDVEGLEESG